MKRLWYKLRAEQANIDGHQYTYVGPENAVLLGAVVFSVCTFILSSVVSL